MPRKCKRRRICAVPFCDAFGPIGQEEISSVVMMELDEYECIRLIDVEGMTQEECAKCMDVARTTVQAIYGSARRKMAECLVFGKELRIQGGEYVLCDGEMKNCEKSCHRRYRQNLSDKEKRRNIIMKFAVTYDNGQVFQHFGHTQAFKVFTAEDGKIVSSEIVSSNGQGHGALAGVLFDLGIEALICGGIGLGARLALNEADIEVFGGVSGDVDAAAEAFAKGELNFDPNAKCNHHGEGHTCDGHHDHGEGHTCGGHHDHEHEHGHHCGGHCHH